MSNLPLTNYKSRITFVASRLTPHWDSLLLFLAFLTLYTLTLSPGLLPADSGEFQLVVPLLGIAHPPGFSLYILLGKLFISLVRAGDYAYRLNLFSAFTSSLTLVLVNRAVYCLTVHRASAITNNQSQITNHVSRFAFLTPRLPGLLAACLLGLSTTFWSQATTANIRSLMALLTALAVYALVQYRLAPTINRLAFFLFTLSLAVVHHLSLAFIAITLLISLISFISPISLISLNKTDWLKLLLASLSPLGVLLYLPIRGAQAAALAPPGLTTLNGFLQHALGLGFGGDFFYFANPVHWPDRFAILLNIFQFQFNDFTLILLAFGLVLFFYQDWKLAAALTAAFAVHCFVAITYRAPQTVEYLLPAYVILVVAASSGLALRPSKKLPPTPGRFGGLGFWDFGFWIFHLSLFIASLFILLRNFPAYKTLAADNSTRAYGEGLLTTANPDALILANWHQATPLWYLQNIEGMRPDMEVEYVFPQGTSLAQNWVDRINANAATRPTLVTSFYPAEYAALPYRFLPILTALPAWRAAPEPLLDPIVAPSKPTHEGGWIFIDGGAISLDSTPNELAQNESFTVQTFWQAPETPANINFFVQLIGPDGLLYGQADVFHPASKLVPREIISDRLPLTVNADAPIADGYRLVTGVYLPDGTRLAPDFTEIARVAVTPRAEPPATRHPSPFGLLAGYDYDLSFPDSPRLYIHWRLDGQPHDILLSNRAGSTLQTISLPPLTGYVTTSHDLPPDTSTLTLTENQSLISNLQSPISNNQLPITNYQEHYIPFGPLTLIGSTLTKESDDSYRVDLEWMANEPITADLVVKVDLVGENYAWRDQSDSVPAGGAIPTLKWIPGIIIRDRHRLAIPVRAVFNRDNPATFQLAVYDHFTRRNLPILDSRLASLGPTVSLGEIVP